MIENFNEGTDDEIEKPPDCSCLDFITENGYGNCKETYDGKLFCYVNDKSICTDLIFHPQIGKNFSREACLKNRGGFIVFTFKSFETFIKK